MVLSTVRRTRGGGGVVSVQRNQTPSLFWFYRLFYETLALGVVRFALSGQNKMSSTHARPSPISLVEMIFGDVREPPPPHQVREPSFSGPCPVLLPARAWRGKPGPPGPRSEAAGEPGLKRCPQALSPSPHALPTKHPMALLIRGITGHSLHTYSFGPHAFETGLSLPTVSFFLLSLRPGPPTWPEEMNYKCLQTGCEP